MISPEAAEAAVRETIGDVLDLDDTSSINAGTTAKDVEGWDSLAHVRIMMALERRFKFQWSEEEITSLKRVGDIDEVVARRAL